MNFKENKIKVVLMVVALLILVNFVSPVISKELKYQSALNNFNQKKWSEAKVGFERLHDYKDSEILYGISDSYDSIEKATQYKEGLTPINGYHRTEFILRGSEFENYNGEYKDMVVDLKNKIKAETNKLEEMSYNVNLIKQGRHSEALSNLVDKKETSDQYENLFRYASALEAKDKGETDNVGFWLLEIPESYNGIMAKEIKQLKIEQRIAMQGYLAQREYERALSQIKKKPQVGMTEEELRNSSWGSPKDVNRTTTENGVDEQFVYSGGKYVYIENGIVTAIQD